MPFAPFEAHARLVADLETVSQWATAPRAPNAPVRVRLPEPTARTGCTAGSEAGAGRVPVLVRPSSAGAPSADGSPRRRGPTRRGDRPRANTDSACRVHTSGASSASKGVSIGGSLGGCGVRAGVSTILWIIAAVLVIWGIVTLLRGGVLAGIALIAIGVIIGPGGFSLFC